MAAQQQLSEHIEKDEITLKEILLLMKEYVLALLRSWLFIGIIAAICAVLFFISAKLFETPIYRATTSFMINDQDSGGGLASLLGGFGLGGATDEFNMDRIIGLAKKGKIVYPALFEVAEIDGKEDFLINHIISIYNYHDIWKERSNTALHNFYFTNDSLPSFTTLENSVLKSLHGHVVGNGGRTALMTVKYDKVTGFIELSVETISQDLSLALGNQLYGQLSSFYILQQTEPQQRTFSNIKAKTDSLQALIHAKEQRLATLLDTRRSLVLQTNQIEQNRLTLEINVLYRAFGQSLESQEQADFLLKNATPFFQVLDAPTLPLAMITVIPLVEAIKGGILGVFLGIIFIIGRKIVRDALNEDGISE